MVAYTEDTAQRPELINKMQAEQSAKVKTEDNSFKVPVVYVVSSDLTKPIALVPFDRLLKDARKEARAVKAKLKAGAADKTAVNQGDDDVAKKEAIPAKKTTNGGLLLPSQDWTNSDGKKITAAVVRIIGDKVVFKMSTGKSVTFPIKKLSKESQKKLQDVDSDS